MTGTKWATTAFIAIIATLDLVATLTAHHRAGAASSLGQVLGWVAFLVLVVPTVTMLGVAARERRLRHRYAKTYARLQDQDAQRG
jgi:hypothetical protein